MFGHEMKGNPKHAAMKEAIARRRGKGLDLMIAVGRPEDEANDFSEEHDLKEGQANEKSSDLAPAGKGGFPEGSAHEEALESPAEEEAEMKQGMGDKSQMAGKPGHAGEVEVAMDELDHKKPLMHGKRMSLGQRAAYMHKMKG